jgi:hypothetical protein
MFEFIFSCLVGTGIGAYNNHRLKGCFNDTKDAAIKFVQDKMNGDKAPAGAHRQRRGPPPAPRPPAPLPPPAPGRAHIRPAMFMGLPLPERTASARSGDGTLANVGLKIGGACQCQDCNQRFDTENALQLHVKYIHGDKVFRVMTLSMVDADLQGSSLGGQELFRVRAASTKVHGLRGQIAEALDCHPVSLSLFQHGNELKDDHGNSLDNIESITVRQDLGRDSAHMFD